MTRKKGHKTEGLVVDAKYEGKHVAFDPSAGTEVIASGKNAGVVVARARKRGVEVPAIIFVPKSDEPSIF